MDILIVLSTASFIRLCLTLCLCASRYPCLITVLPPLIHFVDFHNSEPLKSKSSFHFSYSTPNISDRRSEIYSPLLITLRNSIKSHPNQLIVLPPQSTLNLNQITNSTAKPANL